MYLVSETNPGQAVAQPMQRRPLRRRAVVVCGVLVVALLLAGITYLQSDAFQETIRQRIVSGLTQTLGVQVELEEFAFDWTNLRARLGNLVVRGRVRANSTSNEEEPLFAAREVEASWTLLSVWTLATEFKSVKLTEPRIRLEFYEDGSNNLPLSPPRPDGQGGWAEQLLGLRIGTIEVIDGLLAWNQHRVPLAFQSRDVDLRLAYAAATDAVRESGYQGSLALRDGTFQLRDAATLPLTGTVQFHFYPQRAEVQAMELRAGRSLIRSTVKVNSYRSLDLSMTYDLQLDWQEAGGLIRARGWQGDIRWQGQGQVSSERWNLGGALTVNTSRTGIRNWEHLPWRLRSELTVNRETAANASGSQPIHAELRSINIAAAGGQMTGDAKVKWENGIASVDSDLQVERLGFAEAAQAIRTLPVDLTRLPWSGDLSGPVHVSFENAPADIPSQRIQPAQSAYTSGAPPTRIVRNMRLDADLNVQPSATIPEGSVAVNGQLKGTYLIQDRRLEDVDVVIQLPGTRLTAQGWLEEQQSSMQLGMETAELDVNKPLAELFWRGFSELPLTLDGKLKADVQLSGGWRDARLRGPVEFSGLTYEQTRWDQFAGSLNFHRSVQSENAAQVSPSPARSRSEVEITSGRLRRGAALAEFDLFLELQDGRFVPGSVFRTQGSVNRLALSAVQSLTGSNYPVSGMIEATFDASGTRQNPRGRASVQMTGGTIYDEPFSRLTAELRFDPGPVITASPLRIEKGGTLFGSAVVRLAQRQFDLDLTAADISIKELGMLQSRLAGSPMAINGILSGRISGGGAWESPQLRGELTVRDAGLGALRDGRLRIEFDSDRTQVNWRSDGSMFGGEITGSGKVGLAAPRILAARLDLRNAAIRSLVSLQQEPPPGLDGLLDATANIAGNLQDPKSIVGEGEVTRLEVTRAGVSMRTSGPVELRYANQMVQISSLHLMGDQVDLTASGTIRTVSDPAMNLTAKGQIDLAALSKLDPQVATQGQALLDAQITGTLRRPQWRGRLQVVNGSAQFGRLANSLAAIRGAIVFDGTRGELEGFRAESGGGELLIGGNVRYGEGAGIQFNLNGTVRNVRIRYPEELNTWVDGQLNWTGSTRASLLEGRVTIARQAVTPPNDLAQVLLGRRGSPVPFNDSPFLRNLRLSLAVNSAPEVRLDTRTARNLQTVVEARIQGTGEQPAILGRVGVLGGEIEFAGKRYTINRGEISFLNPFRFEPVLNLNVQARVQQYDITMDFSGPPDRLNVTYRSDPPLPTRDILALLVAGGGRQTSLQPSTSQQLPQVTADSLLSQALSSQIGSRLDRIFGAGRVRVDPQISGLGRPASATVALEQQFRNNLTLLYVTDVSTAQQQYVQAEWLISPKLSVVGIRDHNGLIGVNFQITLRFE
ncbi:MAG: hypothetical protein EXQ56_07685 [Acidobacteria bacterium]|nr:hypothetical protein [Acidobacteriota bacterium]